MQYMYLTSEIITQRLLLQRNDVHYLLCMAVLQIDAAKLAMLQQLTAGVGDRSRARRRPQHGVGFTT